MEDEAATNSALVAVQASLESLNQLGGPPNARELPLVATDFSYEDRRSGVNLGSVDASGWAQLVRTIWEVGPGTPTWSIRSVVAMRGERCAAYESVLDYGNGSVATAVQCVRLSPDLERMEHLVDFDPEDRADAVSLVDRWHAEIDTTSSPGA